MVSVKEVGDKKQLVFKSSTSEPAETPPTVGAAADGGSPGEEGSKDE
ncbi:MAG: hypothetical protein V3R99_06255 [Thermoguttaceae bacterium]